MKKPARTDCFLIIDTYGDVGLVDIQEWIKFIQEKGYILNRYAINLNQPQVAKVIKDYLKGNIQWEDKYNG